MVGWNVNAAAALASGGVLTLTRTLPRATLGVVRHFFLVWITFGIWKSWPKSRLGGSLSK